MAKLLTDKYEFVRQFDVEAADIYRDRKSFLTFREIANYRGITSSQAKDLYNQARKILRDQNNAWLYSGNPKLSRRARLALAKSKYGSFVQLYNDVMKESVDLECLKGIGHKVAVEVHRWCVKTKAT